MMKSIRWMLLLAALAVPGAGASVQAAAQAQRSHMTHAMHAAQACPALDPSLCQGACPRTAAVAAKAGACPVVDPSRCPASCRTGAAGVTAANVKH